MHILHTALYTFPNVLAGRIRLTGMDSGMILKGEITCWSLSGIKGLKEAGY